MIGGMAGSPTNTLLCHRCGALLTPGQGNFYVVRIEAMADPAMAELTDTDLAVDIEAEMARLLEETKDMSARDMMDQVFRRLVIHLCGPCYRTWIEDPTP
jgi:hypothetical protein